MTGDAFARYVEDDLDLSAIDDLAMAKALADLHETLEELRNFLRAWQARNESRNLRYGKLPPSADSR